MLLLQLFLFNPQHFYSSYVFYLQVSTIDILRNIFLFSIFAMVAIAQITQMTERSYIPSGPSCGFSKVRNTFPNPDFYFQKKVTGDYELVGLKTYNETKDLGGPNDFFNKFLGVSDKQFQKQIQEDFNCQLYGASNFSQANSSMPISQLVFFRDSMVYVCRVPPNYALATLETRLIITDNDIYQAGPWTLFIGREKGVTPNQYRRQTNKLRCQVQDKMQKYDMTSFSMRTNQDQTKAQIEDYFGYLIAVNLAAGTITAADLTDRIPSVEKQYVKLLPAGAQFMIGRYTAAFNPNLMIVYSDHPLTDCVFANNQRHC